jgi:hypothetical protein
MSGVISRFFNSFKRSWIRDTCTEVGAGSDDGREGGEAGVTVERNEVDWKETGGGGSRSEGAGCGVERRDRSELDARPLLAMSQLISSRTAHSHWPRN